MSPPASVCLALTAALMAGRPAAPDPGEAVDQKLRPHFARGIFQQPAERFRAGDWPAATSTLQAALARPGGSKEERLRARLLLGMALANQQRFAECATVLEQLAGDDELLAAHAAYQAARCHLRAGAADRALALAARVPDDSVPAAESRLVALDALTRARRWPEVLRKAEDFLARFPRGPRRPEAMAAAAGAAEQLGRRTEAAGIWRRIWATSEIESWSQRAASQLQGARQLDVARRLDVASDKRTAADWVGRGMVLFDRHDNPGAEAAFIKALAAGGLDARLACQARFHLAQSVWKARQRARAQPLFAAAEAACRRAGDQDLTVRALYQRGRCLDYTRDHAEATATFARIERDFPGHSYADDACLRAAEVATEEKDQAGAERLLAALPDRYPGGDMVGEALWRRAWPALEERRFPAARALLEENIRLVPRASIWYAEGRAEYWLGRSHQLEGDMAAAVPFYELAIRRYPLSVYAWQAFSRLEEARPADARRLIAELRPADLPAEPPVGRLSLATLERAPAWNRGLALARTGIAGEAHRELARIGADTDDTDDQAPWAVALVLHRAGMWNSSHALVSTRLAHFRARYPAGADGAGQWQVAYPRAHEGLVASASLRYGFPAALQLAIMREESAFNARAISTANCLGLTMVKPSTAQQHLGRKVTDQELFDPATNVDLGGRELARLLARYEGSVAAVIAAYNAGPGAVDRWRREMSGVPLDAFLERIPYDETRGYTKRVLASYFAYSWIYRGNQPIPSAQIVR